MTAYKSQMTAQFMGYCYKTSFSNGFPKYSVVGVSLEEFTFKPLSPSFKSADRKLQKLFHITPYPIRGKKNNLPYGTGHQFSSTAQKPPCQHLAVQRIACFCSSYFILCIKALVGGGGGGEKTESERAKETSSSEPLMTRAKHVEGKSPNSGYSFSIPWRVAKLNISAG